MKNFQRQNQGSAFPKYPVARSTDAFGRMYTVHPTNYECFYLFLLLSLVNIRETTSFETLGFINDIMFLTYRAVCEELSL